LSFDFSISSIGVDHCIGYDERKYLDFLNSAPMFLATIPIRRVIQIDNLVRYNLDEFITIKSIADKLGIPDAEDSTDD